MEQQEEKKQDQNPQIYEKNLLKDFLGDLFSLERGLPATIMGMFKSPALVIDSYFQDLNKFVGPFKYIVLTLGVSVFLMNYLIDYEALMRGAMEMGAGGAADYDQMILDIEAETGFDASGFMDALQEVSVAITTKFIQILYIVVLAPLLAFVSKIFFSTRFKRLYVMYLYTLATYSVLSLAMLPLLVLEIDFLLFSVIGISIMLFYSMYVQIKYLHLKGFEKYFQSFLSFVLGYILFVVASFIIQYGGAFILFMTRS